ncbi:unnamed protein product [Pleuronectes platessa]|uniref:Uncharacterized protein n=1 Tax=Pleuronectes platessa TaxID=8262 RepID=A0A9N7VYQ6_PLEPL|nr:unnamed protein product [Pleuronectes platessa]
MTEAAAAHRGDTDVASEPEPSTGDTPLLHSVKYMHHLDLGSPGGWLCRRDTDYHPDKHRDPVRRGEEERRERRRGRRGRRGGEERRRRGRREGKERGDTEKRTGHQKRKGDKGCSGKITKSG